MSANNIKLSVWPFYIFGILWCLTGILYAYAGVMLKAQLGVSFSESINVSQPFLQNAIHYAGLYVIIFSLFTIADLMLALIGGVLFYKFGKADVRAMLMANCFLLTGLLAILSDIVLLAFWHEIVNANWNFTATQWQDLWNLYVYTQYASVWLSAAAFVAGMFAFYLLYTITKTTQQLSKDWINLNLILSILFGLALITMIYAMSGGSNIAINAIFVLVTFIVAPIWALWTAHIIKK
jgi:MFS family permease